LVAGTACGGSSDSNAQKAIERLLEIGQTSGTSTTVSFGKLPDGLPDGVPAYPDSTLLASTLTTGSGQKGFGILRDTGDPLDKVYQFYEDALDKAPWQITLSSSPQDLGGIQFASADDPSLVGTVVIQPALTDAGRLTVFLSIQTVSTEPTSTATPFQLGSSKALPAGFPAQIPVYPGATITDTAWARSSGALQWQVVFLVQKAPQDILDYYRTELTGRGFTVTDAPSQGGASILTIANNLAQPPWSGTIAVSLFQQDPSYVQTTLQLTIGSTPTPTTTPKPSTTTTP
jgi:hypothetical protein